MPLEVPRRYLALAPVIVTSPTARCGTTLVQRLLSDSRTGFIYGEDVGHHIRTLTNFLIGLVQQFDRTGVAADADFERALSGTVTDWRPSLMPPTRVLLKAWVETYYQIPQGLADFGQSIGRPVWGFKGPGYPRDLLKAFLTLMPKAKVVYVFRRLDDALMSAKARQFLADDVATDAFCATWATNLREVSELRQDARVLFVRYESLVAEPDEHLRRLEAFTGIDEVRPHALATKVNTFKGAEADGHAPSQYIQPAPLAAADAAAIRRAARPLLDQFYGAAEAA